MRDVDGIPEAVPGTWPPLLFIGLAAAVAAALYAAYRRLRAATFS